MKILRIILGVLIAFSASVATTPIGAGGSHKNGSESSSTKSSYTTENGFNEDGSCDGTIEFFKGTAYQCESSYKIKGVHINNCCNGNMYSTIITRHCSEDENTYSGKRDQKLCVEVGERCVQSSCILEWKDWLGKKHCWGSYCKSTMRGSCCFTTKIARIINQQGRPQIKRGWGSSASPDCRGFTPDEFQKLDFSKIDLSEYINDVQSKVTIDGVDTGDVEQRLKDNMDKFY